MKATLTGWALLIDIDKERLRSTGQNLLPWGVRVSYAPSVGAALSFLKNHRPGIILFHASLEDSFSLLEAVRADRRLSGVPLLLMTDGTEDTELLESLFDSGVSDLIQLPPPIPSVFRNRVRTLLEAALTVPAAEEAPAKPLAPAAAAPESPAFPPIEGVDLKEAVKNCGSEDALLAVMQKFYDSIEDRAGALEGFVSAGDWNNYRIAVHSLKSSARLIGAMQLSQDAKELEADADALRTDEIVSKTPALLELYRSFRERLLPVMEQGDGEAARKEDDRPLLSEEELASACRDLRECISISDFDSADYIIGSLSDYRLADDKRDFVAKLKKAVEDVNKKEILALLSDI